MMEPPELLSVSDANKILPPVEVTTSVVLSSKAVVILRPDLKIISREDAKDLTRLVFRIISRAEVNVIGPLTSILPPKVKSFDDPVVVAVKEVGCVDDPILPVSERFAADVIPKVNAPLMVPLKTWLPAAEVIVVAAPSVMLPE